MTVETKFFEGGGEVKTNHVNLVSNTGDAAWATAQIILSPDEFEVNGITKHSRLAIVKLVVCPYDVGVNYSVDISAFPWPGDGGVEDKRYFTTVYNLGVNRPIMMDFSNCPILFTAGQCLKAKLFTPTGGPFTTAITAVAIDYKLEAFRGPHL